MRKRFSEQQIIGFLNEAEASMPVKELCRIRHLVDTPLPPNRVFDWIHEVAILFVEPVTAVGLWLAQVMLESIHRVWSRRDVFAVAVADSIVPLVFIGPPK